MAPESTVEIILRLGAASLVGAVIGLNREITHKPAGLRTHTLVALGSAVITLISIQYVDASGGEAGSVTRAIQGIITGIGFVGGGVILRVQRSRTVHGLTTAATIWIVAALGMACGLGQWVTALTSMVLALAVLVVGNAIDRFVHRRFRADDDHPGHYEDDDMSLE